MLILLQTRVIGLSLAALAVVAGALVTVRRRKLPACSPAGLIEASTQMTTRGRPPKFLLQQRQEAGSSVFRLRLLKPRSFFVVCDSDVARAIFNQPNGEKVPEYKAMARMSLDTENMFTKYTFGQGWDWARKGSSHAFSSFRLAAAATASGSHLEELKGILRGCAVRGDPFAVSEVMTQLMVNMIATTGFGGYPLNAMEEGSEGCRFIHELEIALLEYVLRQPYSPGRYLCFWNQEVQRAKQASRYLMQLAQNILDWYRASGQLEHDKDSLLSHLCRNENYPSDRERSADVLMYLIAGHDTTGFSIAWTLCELAKQPDLQDAAAADIAQHGSNSELLQCLIKETLRLRPVAALGSLRRVAEPVPLPGGREIPAGADTIIPLYCVFREPWIDRPEEFLPSRWAKGAPQRDDLERQIFPFAMGKRDCIGQRMAVSTMKIVLADIIPRFRFAVELEPEEDYFLTLKPKGALLKVAQRDAGEQN